ncbi:MAG: family 43 glycosylhydrolase [Bacteroidales bacterium]
MRKSNPLVNNIILILLIFTTNCYSQNPLISHIYAADPSAHVWAVDTNKLWIYTSHDVPGTNHHATMSDYHVFSTSDMKNWIDYGQILSIDNVDWGISYAWACDACFRNGKYYLIFCMFEKESGLMRTGLAVSNDPQGPFNNIGYIKGIDLGQDPALFVDDDNTPFLYWGAGGKCYAAQLTDDLQSIIPSTKVDLSDQLFEIFEGPWVHKYQGKYYLSYPGLPDKKWPEEMYYAIADKPLGPYKYQGKYIPRFKMQSGTNHGSIVKFKNDWIAFYHSAWLSDGKSEVRNLMADYLYYNPDGRIKAIIPDSSGLSKGKLTNCIIFLEAENGKSAGGRLEGTYLASSYEGYSGKGYVTGFVRRNYVEVLVQVAKDMKAILKIRLSAEKDVAADILVGAKMMADWDGLAIKKTKGWEEINLGEVQLKEGDNKIRFSSHDNVDLKLDYFIIEPLKE